MMENIKIAFTENGTKTLATAGKYCDRNVDIEVEVATGGGGEVEPIVLTGNCSDACRGAIASKYIELFGDTISTNKVKSTSNMFGNFTGSRIPFELNMDESSDYAMNHMFSNALNLRELPVVKNAYPSSLNYMFESTYMLSAIPEDWMDTWNFTEIQTYAYVNLSSMFSSCYSLRTIPVKILSKLRNEKTAQYTNKIYYSNCLRCYALNELVGLPVDTTNTITSNMFTSFCQYTYRLKNLLFEINEDGSAKTANWKSQTIDFTRFQGYADGSTARNNILNYNSGITADKEVTDDATYQALKNDPDWFTCNVAYSRYNHDSAVATINSLPDTSAYLAEKGGTNTIKFKGDSGSKTDGGAINTLTAEEIAVATARGWTVTLV